MKVSPDEQKLYSGESELTQKESNMEGEIYPCGGVGEFLISMFELYYTNIFLFLILQPSSSHPPCQGLVLCHIAFCVVDVGGEKKGGGCFDRSLRRRRDQEGGKK